MLRFILIFTWLRRPEGVSPTLRAPFGQCATRPCQIHHPYFVNSTHPMVTYNMCFDEHNAMEDQGEPNTQTAEYPVGYDRPEAVCEGDACPSALQNLTNLSDYSGADYEMPAVLGKEDAMIPDFVNNEYEGMFDSEQACFMERWRSNGREHRDDTGKHPKQSGNGSKNRSRSVRSTTVETRRLDPLPRRRTE